VTTPERIRRRQRRETFLVVVTILLACGSVIYNNSRTGATVECQARAFSELSVALNSRADVRKPLDAAVRKVIDSFADAAAVKNPDTKAIVATLEEYRKVSDEYAKKVEDTPIPDYPTGKCD
jgi:hypothetical protein